MWLHACLVFALLCAGAWSSPDETGLRPCPALGKGETILSRDCTVAQPVSPNVSAASGGNLTIRGDTSVQHPLGSATVFTSNLERLGLLPNTQLNLVNLVIVDKAIDIPLVTPPNGSVQFVDARLVVPFAVVADYARTFQQALADNPGPENLNNTVVYTDNISYFHVAYGGGAGFPVSVSLLGFRDSYNWTRLQLAATEDVGNFSNPARNYIISATNATLVPALLAHAAKVTPVPLMVYITDNVTVSFQGGSGAPLPPDGIPINRPVVLMGRKSQPTSVDLRMEANQFDLVSGRSPYANLTLDSLVLENLGFGDARSAMLANGASLSSTTTLWSVLYNRTEFRLVIRNCTFVVTSPVELDYITYWAAAWNSPLPYFQSQVLWTRLKQVVTSWITAPSQNSNSSYVLVEYISGSIHLYNSLLTLTPQVAPPLQLPAPDSLRPLLTVDEAAPVVEVIANVSELPALAAEPVYNVDRPRIVLLTTNMSFAPNASIDWPPEGGLLFPEPLTLTGIPDNSSTGGVLHDDPIIDFGASRSLLRLPRVSRSKQLSLQMLQLAGLPQGPRAEAVTEVEADAFTLLLWQIDRPFIQPGVLTLENITLLLPAPELEFLQSQAAASSGTFGIRPAGAASDTIAFANASRLSADSLMVGSLTGYGIMGRTVLLKRDSNDSRAMPPGYNWPSGGGAVSVFVAAPRQSGSSGLPGWLVAVIVLVVVIVVAGVVAWLVAFARRRHGEGPLSTKDPAAAAAGGLRRGSSRGSSGGNWLLPLLRATSGRQRSLSMQARATSMSFNTPRDGLAGAVSLEGAAAVAAGKLVADMEAGVGAGARDAGPAVNSIREDGGSSSRSRDQDSAALHVREQQQRLKMGRMQQEAEQEALGVVGPTPSFVMGTWRRLHHAISSVSQDLQARRVEAAAGAALPAKPGGSGSHTTGSQQASTETSGTHSTSHSGKRPSTPGGSKEAAISAAISTSMQLQLFEVLGTGNFGCVYRGLWRGTPVAVKVMHVPASSLQGLQRGMLRHDEHAAPAAALQPGPQSTTRERMAVNEVALSSSIAHPHIVQVYTYSLRPVHMEMKDEAHIASLEGTGRASSDLSAFRPSLDNGPSPSARSMPPIVNWELRLVMEYCDQGSLRSVLDAQRLHDRATGRPHHPTIVALSLDVAYAMLHLHSESILHGDLKSSNVLIKQVLVADAPGETAGAASIMHGAVPGARLAAKVSDFGLSLVMDPMATHVSHMHSGTLTHMAPELLTDGHASKASDVYAFGIVMWELATGGRAFAGTPRALLGHQIVQDRRRPAWPLSLQSPVLSPFAGASAGSPGSSTVVGSEQRFCSLAERCWAHEPAARPTFEEIVVELKDMLALLVASRQQRSPRQSQLLHPFAHAGVDGTECSSWGRDAAVLPYIPGVAAAPAAGTAQEQQLTVVVQPSLAPPPPPPVQQSGDAAARARAASGASAYGGGTSTTDGGLSYSGLQRIVQEVLEQERAERAAPQATAAHTSQASSQPSPPATPHGMQLFAETSSHELHHNQQQQQQQQQRGQLQPMPPAAGQ